jgi:hypothetical protein
MRTITVVFLCLFSTATFAQTDRENVVLEALGGFSALALYNTYIVVGAVADGYAYEVYDKEMATNLVTEQISSIQILVDHCDKLLTGTNLQNASDKEYVTGIRTALYLLKDEAAALKGYIETASEDDQKAYSDKRNAAWKKISVMLGLEQK